jgi:NAD(P)-dependent dehydrogenase (short-subunit alcohol dehydrogenase family)
MDSKYLNKLQGQRVLIVGGTKGIGYGVAEAALEFGGAVIVASSKEQNVVAAVEQLKKSYPEASERVSGQLIDMVAQDLEAELERAFQTITSAGGKVDHIVETAGEGLTPITIDNATIEGLEQASRGRVAGTTILAKFARRYMHQRHTSSFTMTGGILGYKPPPGLGLVAGIAGAKDGLRRGLAVDMAPVRVNLVSPGFIHTTLIEQRAGGNPEKLEEILKGAASQSLLNRVGTVEDVAEMYVSLMKSHFVTGSVIHVEGGYLLK